MIRSIRRFLAQLRKAFQWARIGYSDYDWDYSHLLNLLMIKLSSMQKYFVSSGIAEGNARRAEELKEVLALLNNIYLDDFAKNERLVHKNKWGESVLNRSPDPFGTRIEIAYPNANTPEENELVREELLEIMGLEAARRDAAYKKVFQLMGEYVQDWWD